MSDKTPREYVKPRFASEPYPTGRTRSGRTVIVCYCGGGPAHEWRPDGGGMRILKCHVEAPLLKTGAARG